MRIAIIGGGGHAKVCIELLRHNPDFDLVGYAATEKSLSGIDELPHLGRDDDLHRLREDGVQGVFVAIGDNAVRARELAAVRKAGFAVVNAIGETASISPTAILGSGVAIMEGVVINAGAVIRDGVIVNTHASVDHDCAIGECTHLAPGVTFAGGVSTGEGVLCGVRSCALPGVSIGEWSVVGAGAVVTADVPAFATAVGVPAKVVSTRQEPVG